MSNLLDTIMNITVFVFIGLLIWLYFTDFESENSEHTDS